MKKVVEGEIIEINMDPYGIEFTPKKAKVVDVLSVQFTATWMDGTDTLTYRFFVDEGMSWRKKNDDS